MPTRIVLCYPVEAKTHSRRSPRSCPRPRSSTPARSKSPRSCFGADIFCGHAKVPVDWDGVVRQGRLRWIQSSAAGMDHCLVPSVIESDIVVTSASGVLADQVAEHTIALMTAWTRSLPTFLRAQQKKEFIRRPTRDLTAQHGGHCGARRQWPAAGRGAQRLRHSHPGHRPVSDRQAGVRRGPLAGRSARRPAAAWSISSSCACR